MTVQIMKTIKPLIVAVLLGSFCAAPFASFAGDQKDEPAKKPKPYILKTCPVSGEKLDEMGKPYVFVHEGREIKLCCKDCLTDFKKDPAKFIKKIEKAEAKEKSK